MTMKFSGVKAAREYGISILRLDFKKTSFEEIQDLKSILGHSFLLQQIPDAERMARGQESRVRCFRVHNPILNQYGHITHFVIEKCAEEEFTCWIIIKGRLSQRL